MRHDLASAVPEQERDGHGSDGLYSGIEERVEEGGAELGPAQVRIEPAEELGFPALSREELYHRHALEGLLKESIESREPRPHRAIAVAGLESEVGGAKSQDGHEGEGDQGQLPVQQQHEDHDAPEGQDIAHHGHGPAREELADG